MCSLLISEKLFLVSLKNLSKSMSHYIYEQINPFDGFKTSCEARHSQSQQLMNRSYLELDLPRHGVNKQSMLNVIRQSRIYAKGTEQENLPRIHKVLQARKIRTIKRANRKRRKATQMFGEQQEEQRDEYKLKAKFAVFEFI